MYYTYWTYRITTGYVVLAVYAFFLISLLLERSVLEPTAGRNAVPRRSFVDQWTLHCITFFCLPQTRS